MTTINSTKPSQLSACEFTITMHRETNNNVHGTCERFWKKNPWI